MILWLDAHVSPKLVPWFRDQFNMESVHVRDLNLREAEDPDIFEAARNAGAVVITKDDDFVLLVERLGPPPQILWLTFGNTSNARLKEILIRALPAAVELLEKGEPLVEITDIV